MIFSLEIFTFGQAIGFIAFGLSLLSYQFKSQKTMFGIRVIADGLWSFHYYLLSAPAAAATVFIASLRTFLCVFVIPQYRMHIIVVAIFCVWAICIMLYMDSGDFVDLLPALTAPIYGLATYFHENYIKSRFFMAMGKVLWIIIGVFAGSIAEVVSSSIALISMGVAYWRHRKALDKME